MGEGSPVIDPLEIRQVVARIVAVFSYVHSGGEVLQPRVQELQPVLLHTQREKRVYK